MEEKAEQLAITGRYKSSSWPTCRTSCEPSQQPPHPRPGIGRQPGPQPPAKQVEYATIIRSSGTDLLKLINDILDLSKIESGTVAMEITAWPLADLRHCSSAPSATSPRQRGSALRSICAPACRSPIPTDPQRLQQILNNLLSNAFKVHRERPGCLHGRAGRLWLEPAQTIP